MSAGYKYCPLCAKVLLERTVFGEARPACPDPECGFVLFLEPKLVAVVVVEHKGEILLGRRAMQPSLGLWSFPGGYVNRFEKVEEAALREVKEETNLDVTLDGLLGVYSEKGNPVVLLVFRAVPVSAEAIKGMHSQPEEVSELAFFDPTQLPEMAFPSERWIMQQWYATKNSD